MKQFHTTGRENSGKLCVLPPLLGERAGVRASVSPILFSLVLLLHPFPRRRYGVNLSRRLVGADPRDAWETHRQPARVPVAAVHRVERDFQYGVRLDFMIPAALADRF